MSISNYLSTTEFLSFNRTIETSDIENEYLNALITELNSILSKKLEVVTSQTKKYYKKHASSVCWVESWQKIAVAGGDDLVIKKGADGSDELITLVEGEDFRFVYSEPDTTDNIVVGIILYSNYLNGRKDFLQLEGEKGLFTTIPGELSLLKFDLYDLIKKNLFYNSNENSTGGKGEIRSIKMGDVSTNFSTGNNSISESQLNHRQVKDSLGFLLDSLVEQWTNYQNYSASIVG